MTGIKRMSALLAAICLMVAPTQTVIGAVEPTNSGLPVTGHTYAAYRKSVQAQPFGKDTIRINAADYVLADGAQLTVAPYLDKPTALQWTNESGMVSYRFNVSEAGLYTLQLSYAAMPGTGNNIALGIRIDGEYAFEEMKRLEFTRLWTNDGEFRTDAEGNEFSPEQIEAFQFTTQYALNLQGFSGVPFQLYLSSGDHTLDIELLAEPVALDQIRFLAVQPDRLYSEVAADYVGVPAYTGDALTIEGEAATLKTTAMLVPLSDRSDPRVSPSNPSRSVINYIGSTNWQKLGERLTWDINIEQTGLYKLGFFYRQDMVINRSVYRSLLIDGESPFAEARAISFPYGLDWKFKEFAGDEGNAYTLYLEEGTHTIALEVSLGNIAEDIERLQDLAHQIGDLYRQIVMITGDVPDVNRDYNLFSQIPGFEEKLEAYRSELVDIAHSIDLNSGRKGGTNTASIRSMAQVLGLMLDNRYSAHTYVLSYYRNYSTVSALVYDLTSMPLRLDRMVLTGTDSEFNSIKTGFFSRIRFSVKKFLASFFRDYNNASATGEKEAVTIWINWGRDQVRVLNSLIQSSFTPQTGIPVNVKMSNATMIQGILSGNGPDCALHMARTEPVNLALRGQLYDMKQFENWEEVLQRFQPGAQIPYELEGGLYALPDTQTFYMLFYRTDIFEDLGLSAPKTWQEFIHITSILSKLHMQVSLPYTQITQMAQVNSGAGGLSIFPSVLLQSGGHLYSEDLRSTALTTPQAIAAFKFWTSFYTEYKIPVTADFYNRFRNGLMPMGIQPYTMYSVFSVAAPEIKGRWTMAEIPGFEQPDGSVDNRQVGAGSGCAILKHSKNPGNAWEFLQWWTSSETQLRYSNNVESILGVAGRVPTATTEALMKLPWDAGNAATLEKQWKKVQDLPEVPGGYFVARSIDQAYWNVVNNNQNEKQTLLQWSEIADEEIWRKRREYNLP